MYKKGTHYGVDVAIGRADDLDKKMIEKVKQDVLAADRGASGVSGISVLDLGCGAGGQSVRLATLGASVLGIDVGDYDAAFAELRREKSLSSEVLRFIQGDMLEFDELLREQTFDMCCMQRVLHYVPYADALVLLTRLRERIKDRLYISVTGLESDIGLHYADRNKPIRDRFCTLSEGDAQTFSLTEPVCLYTPEECIMLLQESGWEIEACWISAFGNIKSICC